MHSVKCRANALLCFGEYDLKVLGGKSQEGVAWAQKDMTRSQREQLF